MIWLCFQCGWQERWSRGSSTVVHWRSLERERLVATTMKVVFQSPTWSPSWALSSFDSLNQLCPVGYTSHVCVIGPVRRGSLHGGCPRWVTGRNAIIVHRTFEKLGPDAFV